MNCWEKDYEKIRKFIIQKTLNWPNSLIKKISVQHVRFNHPSLDEKQQVASNDLEAWAMRIYNGLINFNTK